MMYGMFSGTVRGGLIYTRVLECVCVCVCVCACVCVYIYIYIWVGRLIFGMRVLGLNRISFLIGEIVSMAFWNCKKRSISIQFYFFTNDSYVIY